ncbi:hypothetical protein U8527_17980 [Kordia algicida OT-1]|uniref:Uncharacterized protein n=1 Tax=Kordia algicida OT-1 TaxID=391587 RepID=A9DID9_9FLAO|nr:hypothetical protein [Kordia algicida]EDP97881.1 hypothetical protein KAOT1_11727 [Kordia algicida OT-1]
MEVIKIVVFVIGLFFGIESSTIIAETTEVTINPKEKTMVIQQKNLLAIYPKEKDTSFAAEEFTKIYYYKTNWNKHLNAFAEKSIVYTTSDDKTLDATITLQYTSDEDLKIFAIDKNRKGQFSIINLPNWVLKTNDGTLNGNYWNFDADKPFSFTYNPVENVPETYTVNKKILYATWKKLAKK